MPFLKKLNSAVNRLFGKSKTKIFEPANKPKSPFSLENELRGIRAKADQFVEEVRHGVGEEWRKARESRQPFTMPQEGGGRAQTQEDLTVNGQEWHAMISSNVDQIRWGPADKILQVIFKSGALYEYYGVEESIFDAFLGTHSPGQFVYHILRAYGYPYAHIGTGSVNSPPATSRYEGEVFGVPSWIEAVQAQAGRSQPTDYDPHKDKFFGSPEPLMSKPAPPGSKANTVPYTDEQPKPRRKFPPAR